MRWISNDIIYAALWRLNDKVQKRARELSVICYDRNWNKISQPTVNCSDCVVNYFRFGKVEGVKILPQKYPKIGLAAFVDFYDVRSAVDAKEAKHKLNGQELRTNFKAKQSEKFDSGPRKWSDDEQEGKKGSEHRRYQVFIFVVLCKASVLARWAHLVLPSVVPRPSGW